MNYYYTQVQGGYRWNMYHRIGQSIGFYPDATSDVTVDGVLKTVIQFSRELTTLEKTKLDVVMASNPTLPPVPTGTVFKIKDIWERLADFNSATGITFKLFYSESVLGSGNIDQVELHAVTTLTNTQKNKVLAEWAKIIS